MYCQGTNTAGGNITIVKCGVIKGLAPNIHQFAVEANIQHDINSVFSLLL